MCFKAQPFRSFLKSHLDSSLHMPITFAFWSNIIIETVILQWYLSLVACCLAHAESCASMCHCGSLLSFDQRNSRLPTVWCRLLCDERHSTSLHRSLLFQKDRRIHGEYIVSLQLLSCWLSLAYPLTIGEEHSEHISLALLRHTDTTKSISLFRNSSMLLENFGDIYSDLGHDLNGKRINLRRIWTCAEDLILITAQMPEQTFSHLQSSAIDRSRRATKRHVT